MKKYLIILITFILPIFVFAGARTELERKRSYAENVRERERFRASIEARQIDRNAELQATYPRAFSALQDLETFSYFGFKLYDVSIGRLKFETFLKEYEAYLNKF